MRRSGCRDRSDFPRTPPIRGGPFRRCVDELGELRRDPFRQGRRVWTARYGARHAGIGKGDIAPAHEPLRGGVDRKSAPLISASVVSTEICEIVPFILNCTYDLAIEHELCEFRNLSGH